MRPADASVLDIEPSEGSDQKYCVYGITLYSDTPSGLADGRIR